MNCQQKSGVFLNLNCTNAKKNTCTNCKKEVCETHSHGLETSLHCEDCYWEIFLYSKEKKEHNFDNDVFITDSNNTSFSSNSETESGFGGGFGGGGFGGGSARGEWTEGDMQSLNSTNTQEGLLLNTDDTFFYS